MFETIHDLVVSLLGELPSELSFVYGFADIFLFIVIILCVIAPFLIIYKIVGGQ